MNPIPSTRGTRPRSKPWPSRPRDAVVRRRIHGPASLLSNAQWDQVAPLLASPSSRQVTDREWGQTRAALEGVLWTLRSGAPWDALPERFPSPRVCRRRWRGWMRDGRWLDFWRAYVTTLGPRGWLEWSRAFVRSGESMGTRSAASGEDAARYAWWLVSARVFWWELPKVSTAGRGD